MLPQKQPPITNQAALWLQTPNAAYTYNIVDTYRTFFVAMQQIEEILVREKRRCVSSDIVSAALL
jgi:hypothetical protein